MTADDVEPNQATLSPFSEQAPDGPFGASARGATIATSMGGSGAPLFLSPFESAAPVPPRGEDNSPFSESAPGGPFSTASPFGASPFGAGAQTPSAPVGNVTGEDEHHLDEPNVPSYALGRRTSVSAESLVPTQSKSFDPTHAFIPEEDEEATNTMPVFPKTAEQVSRIKEAIKPNFLFRNLDEEQEADVLAAMKEVTVTPGEVVIKQGDPGDYFYIVETGELDCFVKREEQLIEPEKGDRAELGKRVVIYKPGTSFGELALMHK
jgi:cAMP-dependent protein kinase regulator